MRFLRAAAASLATASALVSGVAASSDVVDLTGSNFQNEVMSEKLALVEFFAPWCGHCKNLAPHYEEAATELKSNHNIKLAKVDCTENQALCNDHGVKGYPTLKVFRSGEATDYQGPRKADGIISYMVKQSLPAMSAVSASEHDTFKAADRVVLIAYASSESAVPDAFKNTAESLRDSYLFGYSTDLSLSPEGKAGIVLYKKFDEGSNVFSTTPVTQVGLSEFIKENSVPLMDQVSPENFGMYADQGLPIAYLFVNPADPKLEQYTELIKPTARAHKGKVNFVWIDAVKFAEHGKSLGVPVESEPYPCFVIQDLQAGNKRYVMLDNMGDKFGADAVEEFVGAFADGQLQPHLKSAEIPASQDEPVYTLVGKEFDKVIFDDNKDVFVEFYAPWCGHCQRLAPIWDSLAEHFEDFKDTLTIAKMDATENDLPASAPFEIAGFPTIKFKRAGSRDFIEYTGDRSFESLVEFVKENSNNPVSGSENDTDSGIVMGEVEGDESGGHHDEL